LLELQARGSGGKAYKDLQVVDRMWISYSGTVWKSESKLLETLTLSSGASSLEGSTKIVGVQVDAFYKLHKVSALELMYMYYFLHQVFDTSLFLDSF